MNDFDPVKVTDAILSQYKIGDIIPADTLSDFLDAPIPQGDQRFDIAQDMNFLRLVRTAAVQKELLRRNVLGDLKKYALHLIAQEHRVDYSVREAKKKISKSLKDAMNEIINFETNDPNLMAERNDMLNYLDTLHTALNPRSRRMKVINLIKSS
jgi:hypothetical protein